MKEQNMKEKAEKRQKRDSPSMLNVVAAAAVAAYPPFL